MAFNDKKKMFETPQEADEAIKQEFPEVGFIAGAVAGAEEVAEELKEEVVSVLMFIRSKVGGLFIHPFTNTAITTEPVAHEVDGWVQAQVDAGKLEVVAVDTPAEVAA
jgi:hypothetical protein